MPFVTKKKLLAKDQTIAQLVEQRDEARKELDNAVNLTSRQAAKLTAARKTADRANLAWCRVAKDANRAESLFTRAMNLRRAEARRLRKVIADQQRQIIWQRAELQQERQRNAQQEERLLMLQTANEASDWQLARRAGAFAADGTVLQQAS